MNTAVTIKDLIRHREPTPRQAQAVGAYIVANGRKSKAEVLREVGYGEGMATHPARVFNSRAVVTLMENNELSEDDLIPVLKNRVNSEKEHIQMQALDMAFNILGSYAPKKVEGKHEHKVGVFSMSDLRKKMKENNFEIIPKQQ